MTTATSIQPLILASSSPRRRKLLAEAGLRFEALAPAVAEPARQVVPGTPRQQAEALAFFKARSVRDQHPDAWVLGADTLVALGSRSLGKPADADEARTMLHDLSHSRHAVITGLALLGPRRQRWLVSDITWVTMRPMSPADIEAYIASGEWQGKAGAYAIQETADRYVERIDGSWSNVVGLPMELLGRLLARAANQENALA